MVKKAKKRVAKKAARKKPLVLPMKMSSLIKITLGDIRKAEKAEDAFINMGTWLDKDEAICRLGEDDDGQIISRTPVCVMCAAGAVMRYSFKMEEALGPDAAGEENWRQLSAIDSLRTGNVGGAANYLHQANDDYYKFNTRIPDYDSGNPEPFHAAMERLRMKLIKHGL